MSELTAKEIQKACEALPGWRWNKAPPWVSPGREVLKADFDHAGDRSRRIRFHPTSRPSQMTADAIAALESWRTASPTYRFWFLISQSEEADAIDHERFEVSLFEGTDDLTGEAEEWCGLGDDIPTAAIRAINTYSDGQADR